MEGISAPEFYSVTLDELIDIELTELHVNPTLYSLLARATQGLSEWDREEAKVMHRLCPLSLPMRSSLHILPTFLELRYHVLTSPTSCLQAQTAAYRQLMPLAMNTLRARERMDESLLLGSTLNRGGIIVQVFLPAASLCVCA